MSFRVTQTLAVRNHAWSFVYSWILRMSRSRDTQAHLHIVCSSRTREPTIFRADEARTAGRRRLGQMLNTSIRVWSSFCCMLTPSALVRVILSVNYSIAWVKIRCKPLEMKRQQKRLRHGEHCYRPYTYGGGGPHWLVKVSVQRLNIIRYDTTSCSSVAITLKGLAGLEQRTKNSSWRLHFDAKLMLSMQISFNSFHKSDSKFQLKTWPLDLAAESNNICLPREPEQFRAAPRPPVLSIPEVRPPLASTSSPSMHDKKKHTFACTFLGRALTESQRFEKMFELEGKKSPREAAPV